MPKCLTGHLIAHEYDIVLALWHVLWQSFLNVWNASTNKSLSTLECDLNRAQSVAKDPPGEYFCWKTESSKQEGLIMDCRSRCIFVLHF